MSQKKIHIILDFEKSKGGGTNFLSFLKSELIKRDLYTDKWYKADSILMNSHHLPKWKAFLLKFFKNIRIVHRVDGPMRVYNHPLDGRDDIVVWMNQNLANITVFQSEWSHKEHERLYGKVKTDVTVISNVANPNYFNLANRKFNGGKLKIISTVWSQNINKGFKTYEWLDSNLDFSKFSIELVGAPQGKYKNIKCVPYMPPHELGKKLQEVDVFIFPSRYEACSNALLEALATGLPCVTFKGSSNIEIVNDQRLWFDDESQIPKILNSIYENYEDYLPKSVPSVPEIVERYLQVLRG